MESWDEVRTAYQVARIGTVSGAAEVLGVHHATVIRHIDALEARLGAKLHHEHIVPVLDLGEVDGTYFMALAWVDGCDLGTLDGRFRARGARVPAPVVAWFVALHSQDFQPIAKPFGW